MMIFPQHKLIILAVPKTGTMGLARLLGPRAGIHLNAPPQAKHIGLAQVQNRILPLIGPEARDYRSFALIRQPVDWLGSWYRYRLRDSFAGRADSTQGVSFADFIRAYLRPDNRPAYANLGRQSWFMQDRNQRQGVDMLFRYEAEAAYMAQLSDIFGEPLQSSRWNVSPSAPLDLPPGLRQRLEQAIEDDIALWHSAAH